MSDKEDRFLAGQKDCQKGQKPDNDDPDYLRGYAAQYQHEQNMGELTRGH